MTKTQSRTTTALLLLIPLMILTGCRNEVDDRVLDFAQSTVEQQSQQTQQLTEATQRLIEGDAKARAEVLALQQLLVEHDSDGRRELVALQASLDQQRAGLEQERRFLAAERVRAPLVAAALTDVALMLACALPLIVAICALRVASRESFDISSMNEFLVGELCEPSLGLLPAVGERPLLNQHSCSSTVSPPPSDF